MCHQIPSQSYDKPSTQHTVNMLRSRSLIRHSVRSSSPCKTHKLRHKLLSLTHPHLFHTIGNRNQGLSLGTSPSVESDLPTQDCRPNRMEPRQTQNTMSPYTIRAPTTPNGVGRLVNTSTQEIAVLIGVRESRPQFCSCSRK